MLQIVKYSFIWGSKVVPQDVKESFNTPLHHFWSGWKWAEDGPELELSLPLGVTWDNLYHYWSNGYRLSKFWRNVDRWR